MLLPPALKISPPFLHQPTKEEVLSYLGKKQTNTVVTNIAVYAIITVHNTEQGEHCSYTDKHSI